MAKAIYDVSVPNIYEVEKALGDARDKAPRAMKNAVNQTATRAKNMMIRQAKLRYAVSTAGRRHLNLADFKTNPTEPHMGGNWVHSPEFHTGKVLKKSPMDNLTGGQTLIGPGSKGFLVRFESGHVGMVQRIIGKPAKNPKPTRWKSKNGIIEYLYTMSAPSASSMHSTVWREEVEPESEIILQDRLRHEVEKILMQAGGKKK